MKKLILSFLYLLFTTSLFSQSSENLLILNEGYFDFTNQEIIEPVSIGVYNTNSQVYQEVIVIDGVRFASDMIVDGNILYVAADNKIIKYQIGSFEYIDEVEMQGARNLLIHNDNLFVSRGDYDYDTWSAVVFDSYLHVYDKNNLTLISEFDTDNGPGWSTQNLVSKDDQVFVAVNNGFEWNNEKGYVGVVDVSTLTYTNEFDLGENGKNPDNMVIKGDYILTVNNKNWSGSSISRINMTTNEVVTENLADVSTGCGTSALRGDFLNFQVSQTTTLNKYDIDNMETSGVEQNMNLNFYELIEGADGLFYASSTDFFSYGDVHVFNQDNEIVNSFSTGVTPGVFAFYSSPGCTDQEACNYDEFASEDDGSCIYAEEGYDCDGGCVDGYAPLTLEWFGADENTSFNVSGYINGDLYSYEITTEEGFVTECWSTELEMDCFTIEINAPETVSWNLYTYFSSTPFLSGTNESLDFGTGCCDDDVYFSPDEEELNYNEINFIDPLLYPIQIEWANFDWEEEIYVCETDPGFDWEEFGEPSDCMIEPWEDLYLYSVTDWTNLPWEEIQTYDITPDDFIFYVMTQNIDCLNTVDWSALFSMFDDTDLNNKDLINSTEKSLIYSFDLLGKRINQKLNKSFVFELYNDGSVVKKYNLK
tara:strand:+ start:1544 stop:3490 length:1947 start_codon:yes stop_codon:yes gene_type:complete